MATGILVLTPSWLAPDWRTMMIWGARSDRTASQAEAGLLEFSNESWRHGLVEELDTINEQLNWILRLAENCWTAFCTSDRRRSYTIHAVRDRHRKETFDKVWRIVFQIVCFGLNMLQETCYGRGLSRDAARLQASTLISHPHGSRLWRRNQARFRAEIRIEARASLPIASTRYPPRRIHLKGPWVLVGPFKKINSHI